MNQPINNEQIDEIKNKPKTRANKTPKPFALSPILITPSVNEAKQAVEVAKNRIKCIKALKDKIKSYSNEKKYGNPLLFPGKFILIQIYTTDEFYEVARVRHYDELAQCYFYEGFALHNDKLYEFSLYIKNTTVMKNMS